MDLLDRVPPHSLEAEASVLGAILLDNEAAWLVARDLKPEHFYKAANQKIYEAALALVTERRPADVVTVKEELQRRGELEPVGGALYLGELLNAVPSAANAEHYARIVREKALLRSLIRAAREVEKDAFDAGESADAILDRAERRFFEVTQRRLTDTSTELRHLLNEEFDKIESGKPRKGLATHLVDLDRITNGLKPAEFVVLAARPAMGKTSLATTIVRNVAIRDKRPVAFFSLEMSKSQLAQNMLCAQARVPTFRVQQGNLEARELQRLRDAAAVLFEAPVIIDDAPALTIMQLRAKARIARMRHGVQLIVIDYLQLMEADRPSSDENRQQEVSQISRGLKQLARELDVPVLALSQLSRAVEQRSDKRPLLSDLRESGAIEQDADMVLLLYRESYYKSDKPDIANLAEVIVGKNRNGPTGSAKLIFLKEYMRFENEASEGSG